MTPSSSPHPTQSESQESTAPQGAGRKTVLVVDDETDILDSITALMQAVDGNPEVRTARDGKEALDILEAEAVDLIVTDYRMPRMDGLELLRIAREKNPDMPMILITAYPDPSLEETARHTLGCSHFIRKPFDPGEIISAVEKDLA